MKEKLLAKVDEHIERLLEKPELTNEEYGIIRDRLREIKYAEEEAARKLEWEDKMKQLMGLAVLPPAGGGFCAQ